MDVQPQSYFFIRYTYRKNFLPLSANNRRYPLCNRSRGGTFFTGTDQGIRYTAQEGDSLHVLPLKALDQTDFQVNTLHYDPMSGRLFIGTLQQGVYIYDTRLHRLSQPSAPLTVASTARSRCW